MMNLWPFQQNLTCLKPHLYEGDSDAEALMKKHRLKQILRSCLIDLFYSPAGEACCFAEHLPPLQACRSLGCIARLHRPVRRAAVECHLSEESPQSVSKGWGSHMHHETLKMEGPFMRTYVGSPYKLLGGGHSSDWSVKAKAPHWSSTSLAAAAPSVPFPPQSVEPEFMGGGPGMHGEDQESQVGDLGGAASEGCMVVRGASLHCRFCRGW